jgi:hypothetical protein
MTDQFERRAFRGVGGAVLLIPLLGGSVGAFGGIEGLAWLFGVTDPIELSPALRNDFRAICLAFVSWVLLVAWSLAALRERAAVFRIVVGCAFVAGFARLTGWLVEGYPGLVPIGLMAVELVGMPVLLVWHARLVRATQGVTMWNQNGNVSSSPKN